MVTWLSSAGCGNLLRNSKIFGRYKWTHRNMQIQGSGLEILKFPLYARYFKQRCTKPSGGQCQHSRENSLFMKMIFFSLFHLSPCAQNLYSANLSPCVSFYRSSAKLRCQLWWEEMRETRLRSRLTSGSLLWSAKTLKHPHSWLWCCQRQTLHAPPSVVPHAPGCGTTGVPL